MRAKDLNILTSVVSSYDQTKTTVTGNMAARTINGQQVLAPPPNVYFDTFADSGLIPLHVFAHPSGYVFHIQGTTSPFSVVCYQFNYQTGAKTYLGRVNLAHVAGTATIRSFKVIMGGGKANIVILTTNTTATNGGLFFYNTLLSDFVPAGFPTIALATTGETSALKRGFFLQESGANGGGGSHLMTSGIGAGVKDTGEIYVLNGVAATYQAYKMNVSGTLTATTAAGVTTDAFGGSNGFKTGNLPAMTGTALNSNSVDIGTIGHGPNAGSEVITFGTTTFMYNGTLADLAASVVVWPTLQLANVNPPATESTAITAVSQNYSGVLDKCFILSNGRYYLKQYVNNQIDLVIGAPDNTYYEGLAKTPSVGALTINGSETRNGWLFIASSTVGQRGIIAADIRSDALFDYSYFVTPVTDMTKEVSVVALQVRNILSGLSSSSKIYFRTTGFGYISGNWIALSDDFDSSVIPGANQVQFKVAAYYTKNASGIAPALTSIRAITRGLYENSDNWRIQVDNTSRNAETPVLVAAKMVQAYPVSAQTVYFNIFDQDGNLLTKLNTSTHFAQFRKSSNGGTSFTAMTGPNDYANTGAGTTVIQLNWAAPAAGVAVVSVQES